MDKNINKEEVDIIIDSFKKYLKLVKKVCNLTFIKLTDVNVKFLPYNIASMPDMGLTRVHFKVEYNLDYDILGTNYQTQKSNIEKMVYMIYRFEKFVGTILISDKSYMFSYDINVGKVTIKESYNNVLNLKIRKKTKINDKKFEIIKDFIKFIEKKLSLKGNVLIDLQDKKDFDMTTGAIVPHHHIKVLCKNRMLVDILRTIAHEWVHEYQHEYMRVTDNQRKKEIGGWVENQANAMAGILVKRYIFNNKKLKDELF